ncbi:dol-P-Glc:Glc(2)Man(9)GlcNAc(2)-PP-Dol alpha-1,2-glucosyltransferase-like [Coffea arabica]|uniref:Dol-P-Glc:Glc(2)Man(9)GlcNAc(2)-PP-Dol alpha-1,2-glucosyltransferase n=1 Tax=Coffea arabica TaxID=13443 RepID=A0ABM4ULG6_COFAR|nr:dol-P-Glc:Glc(2)Man(9)GlcNAc(2)-PP-Dol alpha-1,2-glucosyltransferase [Coffea arabica]
MGRKAVALIVSSWIVPISILVNHIVPEPYMDEIFHVPQAQKYCKANFTSWDPMITTPPGLYFVSLAHVASLFPGIHLVNNASSFSDACSVSVLRFTNGVLAVFCSILIYDIITHLRPALTDRKATFHALVLTLYPLHWFFTFLYYTDVASLTAVLAAYLCCLKKNYWISALLGAVAVLMRQTNIIWILFIVCSEVIKLTLAQQKDDLLPEKSSMSEVKVASSTSRNGATSGSNLRKRRSGHVDTVNHSVAPTSVHAIPHSAGLCEEMQNMLSNIWQLKWELVFSFSPFFLILVAFLAFVYWNGSIVLGAKDAHKVSPHFAQLLYFSLVSALFMAPVHFTSGQFVALVQSLWKKKPFSFFQLVIALTISFLSVHFFSIAHPYLLADNRHYPFYLWRKVIASHWIMKYLLVPLYVYSWFCIFNTLVKTQKKIWVIAYFLASAATLIPAPLIEFRYYTIPFFFLVLHSDVDDTISWLLMGLLYVAINLFTMSMFLWRPFYWNHEPGLQRFIW